MRAAGAMTYDQIQLSAVLVTCAVCGRSYYMTVPQPVCQSCRRKQAKR